MKIDKTNYEIWFIDWLDGRLTGSQAEELMSFLKTNPQLKEELYELSSLSLKPLEGKFQDKDLLKKTTSDIPASQFELLSIAHLEMDLSPEQLSELQEIISRDPEKRRLFEFIQKTRLIPPDIIYKPKYLLIKRPLKQRVIRLSVIGLGIAAAIALIIITYPIIPQSVTRTNTNGLRSAATITPDTSRDGLQSAATTRSDKPAERLQGAVIAAHGVRKDGLQSAATTRSDKPAERLQGAVIAAHGVRKDGLQPVSSPSPEKQINAMQAVVTIAPYNNDDGKTSLATTRPSDKILVLPEINLKMTELPNSLIALRTTQIIPPSEDQRSNVGRFISKVFREKILKQTTEKTSPLEAYEIAEAGITGLNKLFGWQMALNKNIDENGDPGSVYFSSRLLKINSPVNKSEVIP